MKQLTLTELRGRMKDDVSPIYLNKDEFKQYVDMFHPDDSLLGPYLAGNAKKYLEDRKRILKEGKAHFRGVEVIRK